MKGYRQFLFESQEDTKIQWIKNAPISSTVESKILKQLIKKSTDNFYQPYYTSDNKVPILYKDKPILLYYASKERDIGDKYLSKNNIKQTDVYNRTNEMSKSMNKKDWHELLGDKEWLPKTVIDTSKIKSLEFPIIAKPSEGHSGIGIMKFDTIEDCERELSKSDCNLDTFSEMIKDIDTEYRFIFVKGNLIMVHERIPIEEINKTIDNKKPEESLGFLYVEQDLDKEKYEVSKIVKEFRKEIELDFYALDIMRDKKGKYWIIESNSAIGMGGNTLARTYEGIYKDFYGKHLTDNQKSLVESICGDYYKEISRLYTKELNKSKNPKIYK